MIDTRRPCVIRYLFIFKNQYINIYVLKFGFFFHALTNLRSYEKFSRFTFFKKCFILKCFTLKIVFKRVFVNPLASSFVIHYHCLTELICILNYSIELIILWPRDPTWGRRMTQKHIVLNEMVYFLNSKYGQCEQKYNFTVLWTLV